MSQPASRHRAAGQRAGVSCVSQSRLNVIISCVKMVSAHKEQHPHNAGACANYGRDHSGGHRSYRNLLCIDLIIASRLRQSICIKNGFKFLYRPIEKG